MSRRSVAAGLNDEAWERLRGIFLGSKLAEITSAELRALREMCEQELQRRQDEDGNQRQH